MATRREFLQIAAGIAGTVGLQATAAIPTTEHPLRILMLGGTGFIGPHQVEYALARGHKLTLFNRGRQAGLYGDAVEELVGNRDTREGDGLAALSGSRTWDVVIDNSGYVPRHVRDSANLLKGRVGLYLYTSTVAVYDFQAADVFTESGPLAVLDDPSVETVTNRTYGPLKAECDRIVRSIYGEDCTIVRPTYIVGPGDSSDRFTYWVVRINRGGDVLAPSGAEREIQWIDVRDLCPWMITLAEKSLRGTFNAAGPAATGPASGVSRAGLMWGLRAATAAPVSFHWPDDALLDQMKISLPMLGTQGASYHLDNAASIQAGIAYRPLVESARDTLAWWQAAPQERRNSPRGWLSPDAERAAIEALG